MYWRLFFLPLTRGSWLLFAGTMACGHVGIDLEGLGNGNKEEGGTEMEPGSIVQLGADKDHRDQEEKNAINGPVTLDRPTGGSSSGGESSVDGSSGGSSSSGGAPGAGGSSQGGSTSGGASGVGGSSGGNPPGGGTGGSTPSLQGCDTQCTCGAGESCYYSCETDECEVTCETSSDCLVETQDASLIVFNCANGASCVTENPSGVALTVSGFGSGICGGSCADTQQCTLECPDGGCHLDCEQASSCAMICTATSQCFMGSSDPSGFVCPFAIEDCGNGFLACGAECQVLDLWSVD